MTTENKQGQLACIDRLQAAMLEVQRAVIITGVAIPEVNAVDDAILALRAKTENTPTKD